ncbi:MAG: hypothetical protein KF746_23090 [Chitinophagaceae bacterium]|nr:hypothetical protein [Chitinophagaceae bacterium]
MIIRRVLFYCFILFAGSLFAQQEQPAATMIELPPGYIPAVDKKINGLDHQLSRQSEKYLDQLARHEEKLLKRLSTTDSSTAITMLKSGKKQYEQLNKKLMAANGKAGKLLSGKYLPGADSLATSLSFLKEAGNLVSKTKDIQQQLGKSLENLNVLQDKLNEADAIQRYVQQRQQQLKELLSNYTNLPKDISKLFGKYRQAAFYYSQQLAGLRESLNQPDKLIAKTLAVLQRIPEFSKFWQKHSILSQMFPVPDNYGSSQALAGLQTRAGVQQLLQQQIGVPATNGANANPAQYLQQQMQQAQGELSKLKEKLNQLGINGGGSSDMVMPEGFTPNSNKTKKFFDRIDIGTTFQTRRASNYFSTMLEGSVTASYRVTDKMKIGAGISGKAGLGKSWKQVRLTAEGVGCRAYAEWKAPDLFKTNSRLMSSLWLYAGAEMNYTRTVESLAVFKNYSNWSRSALAGLSKKYSMSSPLKKGKKMQGSMQVLYDFLHKRSVPPTPAFVWRVGYEF